MGDRGNAGATSDDTEEAPPECRFGYSPRTSLHPFRGSSAVERQVVTLVVAGSIPALGAGGSRLAIGEAEWPSVLVRLPLEGVWPTACDQPGTWRTGGIRFLPALNVPGVLPR